MHEKSWFLAQLKPNSAQIAQRNLRRQMFQTFLPLEEETRLRYGKHVTTQSPLFPGYIFIALDMAQGLWRQVNSTYGVSRILSIGKTPAIVPKDFVSELMQRCDSSDLLLPPEQLKLGDQVTVTKGPFANFAAEVEKIAHDRRVWVLMDMMGSKTRVAVSPDNLRLVQA
jgi:transcriptional antiterminator RfaH